MVDIPGISLHTSVIVKQFSAQLAAICEATDLWIAGGSSGDTSYQIGTILANAVQSQLAQLWMSMCKMDIQLRPLIKAVKEGMASTDEAFRRMCLLKVMTPDVMNAYYMSVSGLMEQLGTQMDTIEAWVDAWQGLRSECKARSGVSVWVFGSKHKFASHSVCYCFRI
jgi:hypothetical protein